jgi:hypothetical protein
VTAPQPPQEDLPLIRDVPERADPGAHGRQRIARISQTIGVVWIGFWWFLAPDSGDARWIVGGAGGVLIIGARAWLHMKAPALLDVSHLDLRLRSPVARRGSRVEVELAVTEPEKVRGAIDVTVTCVESYAYKVDSDRQGPSRRTGHNMLWKWPQVVQPLPTQTIAFDIAKELPFSYAGDYVKYTWTVTATERVERGLDPTIELPLRVLP